MNGGFQDSYFSRGFASHLQVVYVPPPAAVRRPKNDQYQYWKAKT